MRWIFFLALIVFTFSGSACSQNDNKGRANFPSGTDGSNTKATTQGQQTVNVPNVVGKTLAEAVGILDAAGLKIGMAGTGSVIKQQSPAANSQAAIGSTVLLTR